MTTISDTQDRDDVLAFWFPEDGLPQVDAQTHRTHWLWRMQGGADQQIVARFSGLTERAAQGHLDHWAQDPQGRLALIILLDQFSRSVWRGKARAYAQDSAALSLTIKGMSNGHYSALTEPWSRIVYGLPLGHCEGPDHLQRLDLLIRLRQDIADATPLSLRPIYAALVQQARDVRDIIAAFGRHPHRNAVFDRPSTPSELTYIAEGRFPHLRAFRHSPDDE